MSTVTDLLRGNFNGDTTFLDDGVNVFTGSVGDLFLFDNFGDKAIWLEDGIGGRLATSPNGFDLPFTGPTWHVAAIADFDSSAKITAPPRGQSSECERPFVGKRQRRSGALAEHRR